VLQFKLHAVAVAALPFFAFASCAKAMAMLSATLSILKTKAISRQKTEETEFPTTSNLQCS
jgi:hypothetical protein